MYVCMYAHMYKIHKEILSQFHVRYLTLGCLFKNGLIPLKINVSQCNFLFQKKMLAKQKSEEFLNLAQNIHSNQEEHGRARSRPPVQFPPVRSSSQPSSQMQWNMPGRLLHVPKTQMFWKEHSSISENFKKSHLLFTRTF